MSIFEKFAGMVASAVGYKRVNAIPCRYGAMTDDDMREIRERNAVKRSKSLEKLGDKWLLTTKVKPIETPYQPILDHRARLGGV